MEDLEGKLRRMGLELPAVPRPVGAYVPALTTGGFLLTSGQLPFVDGQLLYTGRVGETVDVEQARAAARVCALNGLAAAQGALTGGQRLGRVVRLGGYVQAAMDFHRHAEVVNAASELLQELFGEAGTHARIAVGVASLPLNAPVELELMFAIEEG